MKQQNLRSPGRARSVVMAVAVVAAALLLAVVTEPLVGAAKAAGAGKPPSVTYTGVTATFRDVTELGPDGIRSDGESYVGNPLVGTTEGAFFRKAGSLDDFSLKLDGTSGRKLTLDFINMVTTPPDPCGGTRRRPIVCRKNFDAVTITEMLLIEQGLLVRPANADGSDLAGGMHAIGVGYTVPGKLKVNFPFPDRNGTMLWWTVRFNPRDYPGSVFVRVTRTATSAWTIEAGGDPTVYHDGWAELVASTDGSSNQTHEGWYLMPFLLTVTE